MTHIIKAKETMTAKERVLKTFNLERTDRVTIGYEANPAMHARVAKELGAVKGSMELIFQALGVDYRHVAAKYAGLLLFKRLKGEKVDPVDGFYTRWVEHETGGVLGFLRFSPAKRGT